MNYDLEQRTKQFSKVVITLLKTIKLSPINTSLVSQLVRSATSVGANYSEANAASSKSDFRNKIYPPSQKTMGVSPWMNAKRGSCEARRAKQDASADSAEKMKDTTGVSPWRLHICRKEIQETKYWLELLAETESALKLEFRKLWKEAHELTLIFNKISHSLKLKHLII